ncbi:unnamed protein product [Caenorhabditis auriculariae]|uniref:Uncharacterized protein n=1 Tax=Caenorhabditis auriculariae TaxID=2777116 RepID=A0A8S1HG71_9PELO|nr:unnamed protein product [Caenorhabditis auriculariae]
MNEIIFGDPGPGCGIREILVLERIQKDEQQKDEQQVQERLLIRKDPEKNPKKKRPETMNEIIFRGSGPGPRDPSRKASDPENPEKSQEKDPKP